MSFLKKKNENLKNELGGAHVAITSIIGTGLNLSGDLCFTGKLRLDGTITGNIKGEHLILGETGIITGDVDIQSFTCQGRVDGNIKARNLNVVKGCRIDGNVEAVNLLVEGGASLNGEVKVESSDLQLIKGEAVAEKKKDGPAVQSAP
jgi:cytoskeletal protein CcmA (bactofilin family)